jgi:hypothetical protein
MVAPMSVIGQTVSNGSLTGPRAMAQLPPGWAQYHGNSSDTADATGPFGTYNLSPNGGTFVRCFSWQRDTEPFLFNQREGLEQIVSGLTVGRLYEMTFYQSSVNGINSTSGLPFSCAAGYWTLAVDGVVTDATDLMSPPNGTSLANVWVAQSLSFHCRGQFAFVKFFGNRAR